MKISSIKSTQGRIPMNKIHKSREFERASEQPQRGSQQTFRFKKYKFNPELLQRISGLSDQMYDCCK